MTARPEVAPLRHLGRARLVNIGLNSVVGGGIFILPATVAALVGPASLVAYLAAGALVLGIGTVLARLASRFESSGGPYLYIERAFGPVAGFQAGWLFWLARLTAFANLLNGAALYLGALVPVLARPWPRGALVLGLAASVTAVNVAGIRPAAGAADVLAIAKIAPLVLLGAAGLLFLEPARLVPAPVAPGSFLRAVLLLLYAFSGFEILTVPAEEARDPRADMPFALLATILTVCGVYVLVDVACLGALPALGREAAPLASLAGGLFGGAGRTGMTGVAAVSMVGCSLASLLGAGRMLYAMGRARQVPPALGALDRRFRTPARATLLTGALGAWLAIAGGYAFLAAVSSGARLLIFLACCLALLTTRRRVVPMLTAASLGVLLIGLDRQEVVFGMMGVGAGLGLYLLARRGRRASRTPEAS